MNKQTIKQNQKERRKKRARSKISGTKECPRLSVFRSNKAVYLQLIDDENGKTIVSAHSREIKKKSKKVDAAFALGKLIAEKALAKKTKKIIFDKGSYRYHGRVKAVAEGAREAGLQF